MALPGEIMKRKQTLTLTCLLGIGCLLMANDEIPLRITVSTTEHADLPAGGVVRLKNSTGELRIEGWDQPGVEITAIKSTKLVYPALGVERERASHMLDEVKVSVALEGNDVVIGTVYPRHRRFLPRPSVGARDFNLEYLVKVPRNANIVVDHDAGEIHFDDLSGDIHATMNQGTIILRLPAAGTYGIDANSRIGDVTSDFPGTITRRHFGHAFVQGTQAAHNLYLRTGFGDIVILRMHRPAAIP
jgi:hypothetical protein